MRILAAVAVLGLVACVNVNQVSFACEPDGSCSNGSICCPDRQCRSSCAPGGGGGGTLTGGGAGGSGGSDAGADSGVGTDAGTDAGATDAGSTDAGTDAGTDDAGCARLEAQYAAEFLAAKLCNPNSLIEPCTETRPATIGCGCASFINAGSGGTLDQLTAKFTAESCVPTACPRCSSVDAGVCTLVVGGGSNDGECIDR